MSDRYKVTVEHGLGIITDTQAQPMAIVWRGPFAVACEIADLAEQLHQRARREAEARQQATQRQASDNFEADIIGREIGRAVAIARGLLS